MTRAHYDRSCNRIFDEWRIKICVIIGLFSVSHVQSHEQRYNEVISHFNNSKPIDYFFGASSLRPANQLAIHPEKHLVPSPPRQQPVSSLADQQRASSSLADQQPVPQFVSYPSDRYLRPISVMRQNSRLSPLGRVSTHDPEPSPGSPLSGTNQSPRSPLHIRTPNFGRYTLGSKVSGRVPRIRKQKLLGYEEQNRTRDGKSPPNIQFYGLKTTYAVIIDCGSSGSRVYIFTWKIDPAKGNNRVGNIHVVPDKITEKTSFKKNPGISEFSGASDDQIEAYIEEMYDYLERNLQEHLRLTPIYMMATAGMRLLSLSDKITVMNKMMEALRRKGVQKPTIRTLEGFEEGMYQWMTMKLLAGTYDDPGFGFNELTVSGRQETEEDEKKRDNFDGILEMGGASLQVAFSVNTEIHNEINERMITRIRNYPHAEKSEKSALDLTQLRRIFRREKESTGIIAVSFLGLGINSVYQLYRDLLIDYHLRRVKDPFNEEGDRVLPTIVDPCRFRNFEGVEYIAGFENKDYLRNKYMTNEIPPDVIRGNGNSFFVIGSGDARTCSKHLHDLIDRVRNERFFCKPNSATCASDLLGLMFTPFKSIKFVAVANFFYPINSVVQIMKEERRGGKKEEEVKRKKYNEPKKKREILRLDYLFMYEKVGELCKKNLKDLQERHEKIASKDPDRLSTLCFKSMWILVFLEYGLGLQPHDSENIVFQNEINGQQLEWTFGAIEAQPKKTPIRSYLTT